jgi:hypothetical protein
MVFPLLIGLGALITRLAIPLTTGLAGLSAGQAVSQKLQAPQQVNVGAGAGATTGQGWLMPIIVIAIVAVGLAIFLKRK